jgi:MFS family permease
MLLAGENAMAALNIGKGWLLVAGSFLTLSIIFSARATLGLAMPAIETDMGWSRSFMSAVMSAALILMAVVAPIAGRLLDKVGPRIVLLAGTLMVMIGAAVLALATEPWMFVLGFAGLSGVGFALVTNATVGATIALAFTDRRGLATGIATSGSSAGQLVFIPVIAAVLAATTWRNAFWLSAALAAVILVVLYFLLERKKREPKAVLGGATLMDDVRYLFSKPVFYLLFFSFFMCGVTSLGIVETHFMPYATLCGFPPVPIATAYGLLSAFNLVGMIAAGWLADRVNRVALLAAIYFIRGLTFFLLVGSGANYEVLIAFAVLFGLVDYATVPITVSLAASHLGTRVLGLAMGLISCGHQLGSAAGAIAGGVLFDATTNYSAMWLMGVWTAMLAAALALLIFRTAPAPAAPAAA